VDRYSEKGFDEIDTAGSPTVYPGMRGRNPGFWAKWPPIIQVADERVTRRSGHPPSLAIRRSRRVSSLRVVAHSSTMAYATRPPRVLRLNANAVSLIAPDSLFPAQVALCRLHRNLPRASSADLLHEVRGPSCPRAHDKHARIVRGRAPGAGVHSAVVAESLSGSSRTDWSVA
jgi:hypothetical protein